MTRRLRKRPPFADTVLGYFFHLDSEGRPVKGRKDLVTREELWGALDWYHRRAVVENRWYRRLWRALKRSPVVRVNPFALVRSMVARKEERDG